MNTRYRVSRFALVALMGCIALATSGCFSTSPPKPDQATIIKEMAVSNNAVVMRQIDLQIEREKTKQIELGAEASTALALQNIGITATDAHSKVVASVALLGASKGRGSGAGQAPASTPQLPPQQLIQPERDAIDRGVQIVNALMPGGVATVLSPILAANTAAKQIQGATEQARIAGETTRAQWLVVGGMNHDAVAGMQGLGAAGFQSVGDIVATLGRPNVNTWTVGGDYAGGNLTGRYSGTNSGNNGLLNTGAGTLNTGNDARFTSPGPYTITCASGATAQTSASGAVTCPVATP